MDFFKTVTSQNKQGQYVIEPVLLVKRSKDIITKGQSFYAVWDESTGFWSTNIYDVPVLIDKELFAERDRLAKKHNVDARDIIVRSMVDYSTGSWDKFYTFVKRVGDSGVELDSKLIFQDQETRREDYATHKLPYSLNHGDYGAWTELMEVLYSPEELHKIEWAIGSIIAGDSPKIQKFLVFFGPPGTGKSTVLNIIQKLFAGYYTTFDAKALGSNSASFSTEVFKGNPLVAIQHDGDLSRISDNTKLNSIIAHEEMVVNEKYKASYSIKSQAFLFMGTNHPVNISDAKSGIIRRLIDVNPTGHKLKLETYSRLMEQITQFQLGAIAQHCLDVYKKAGIGYYDSYRPSAMMQMTDPFLNFVTDNADVFMSQPYITTKQVFAMYKEYCEETEEPRMLSRRQVQAEMMNYFTNYDERKRTEDGQLRNVFSGFEFNKIKTLSLGYDEYRFTTLEEQPSILDEDLKDQPAQLAKEDGTPSQRWNSVKTTLSDIDTSELHYVKVPENHIVIDFDLKDETGEKDLEANLQAASIWPETYCEVSKSGKGLHLHYIYDGDVSKLANVYSDGIEIKVYKGDASLRRMLTKCNNLDVATISEGLPLKEREKKKMFNEERVGSERGLRRLIERNLRKEIHPGTKPSVEFIKKILDEAYADGLEYNVEDMRNAVIIFAKNSTNHSAEMLRLVTQMKFKSNDDSAFSEPAPKDVPARGETSQPSPREAKDERLAFFDVEVYPNLFLIVWKYAGGSHVVMMNPSAAEVEELFQKHLVGFNNRRYDNHILYGRYMGYDNEALYNLSQKIINNDHQALFAGAYSLSYADIYDFSSKKQSLKQFEIDLGISHMEMEIPWDEPVPDNMIEKVIEYCKNDVDATEAVFNARHADFTARQILAELSGLTPNDTTQQHTAKIIFGNDKNASSKFVYTDLSKMFPGYKFESGKSYYKDEKINEGGYVYSEPGLYHNVAVLDVASMHPTSIEQLNLFGPYTKNFSDLKSARIAIKHGDFDTARKMLDGKLAPYLNDEKEAKDLAYALKIVINIVYGLTSAKFANAFRDIRNKDNIVAKRGSLFMIELKNAVQAKGYQVIHIKTDSIKIPEADEEIIKFVSDFGKKYGYDFEHEATYDSICLVNDAVYIAREGDKWEATGAQFAHPYVYKTLFTHEDISFKDYVEPRNVKQGAMYLDLDYDKPMALSEEGRMRFLGRTGEFVPVHKGTPGSGVLYRVKDDKYYAVAGTKGWVWMEALVAKENGGIDIVDTSYAEHLATEAKKKIEEFGSFDDLFPND